VYSTRGLHCKVNSNYVFTEIKLRGLVLSFHFHTSVSDLYIPRIGTRGIYCKEDSNYAFPETKQRGLVPNFHIHTPVSDLYINRISPPILLQPIRQTIVGMYKLLTDI
jgi:hypothetical protein